MSAETAAPLSLRVTPDPRGLVVVTVGGDLDVDTATALRQQLADQLREGRRHIVLDLTGVPFMDSSGLNIILRTLQEARRLGGSLRLAAPVPAVRRLLDLTGVSISAPVYDSVDEALEAPEAPDVPEESAGDQRPQ